jgi:hypothetical protein
MKLKFLKYWETPPLLYSYAFILDPRANMKGFFNMLELLTEQTGTFYSVYYGDVKDEMSRLYSKYEQMYGEKRSESPAVPSAAHAGKRKQAWGRLFGGPGASPACSSSSAPSSVNELTTYMDSDLSLIMEKTLIFCYGGVITCYSRCLLCSSIYCLLQVLFQLYCQDTRRPASTVVA